MGKWHKVKSAVKVVSSLNAVVPSEEAINPPVPAPAKETVKAAEVKKTELKSEGNKEVTVLCPAIY